MTDSETIARKFVSSQFDPGCAHDLKRALSGFHRWQNLIECLERHGLALIAYDQIQLHRLPADAQALRVFKGLAVRHRRQWQALHKGLLETAALFEANGIDFLCLKGAALANMVYPVPEMRPMCDLDILIRADSAARAQQLLIDAGFHAALTYRGYLRNHHHLPAATRQVGVQTVMIELHTQALSPDMRTPINWDSMAEPARSFNIGEHSFNTLGHIDMLRHLCLHTFTRTETVRLIGVTDMLRYALHYFDAIDWNRIQRDYPIVINALRCLHPLVTVPARLHQLAPPPLKTMKGVGRGMTPLQHTMRGDEGLTVKVKRLLCPPPWWTHVFYNVSPEKSLLFTRLVRHPLLLLNWTLRKNWHRLADKVAAGTA